MPTLQELIVALTRHPGIEAERFTAGVQESPPSGGYVGVATGADAARRVVTTDLARLDVSGTDTDYDPSWYDGAYVWMPTLGLQRTIPTGGYTPNDDASSVTDQAASDARVAVLTTSRSLGTTVAAGTACEVHRPAPPMYDADGKVSLRSWLNRAGATMRMPIRLTLTGVNNAYRYSLAASAPWLRDEGDLIRVSDREYLSDQDPYVLPGTSRLRFDGGTPYLIIETPIAAGYPFYADVWIPRKNWIGVHGATMAYSTVGLVNLDDVCTGDTEIIALLAYFFICRALATRHGQGVDAQWEINAQRVAASVAPYLAYGQPSGPTVTRSDSWYGGDHPMFLRRRQSGGSRRWS